MIPISDSTTLRRSRPYVNVSLILISTLIFVYEAFLLNGAGRETFFFKFGFIPAEMTGGVEYTRYQTLLGTLDITTPIPTWGTIFTSMFIHADWMHFGSNMLFLWVFGDNVEDRLGHIKYLLFYLLAGTVATWTQIAVETTSQVPHIGASGAIAGVLGAYLLLYPYNQIKTIVIFFFITFVRVPAVFLLGFWLFLQFFSGIGSLGPSTQSSGVAYWAHIGGFITGLVIIAILKIVFWREPVWPSRPNQYRRPRPPHHRYPPSTQYSRSVPPAENFPDWLSLNCQLRQLTLEDLEIVTGIANPILTAWLTGNALPTQQEAQLLAYALGLSRSEVLAATRQ